MQIFDLDTIGTHLELSIDTTVDVSPLFTTIRERLVEFEQRYSRFIEDNWLYQLNVSRHATLDTDAQNMLLPMLDIARRTDGYFDPTISRRLADLGYSNAELSKKLVIEQQAREKIQPVEAQKIAPKKGFGGLIRSFFGSKAVPVAPESRSGNYRDIDIQGDEVILHGDVWLEFGGIGKGYLIDVIHDLVVSHLISVGQSGADFLINFAGDLYGHGNFRVGLESPFASDEVIGTIDITDGYLACSAGTRRKWGDHHHLIDPHTGRSAQDVIASYVESSSGSIADAYATTLCVMPWSLARETLDRTPEISGVIVRSDGTHYKKSTSKAELFS